MTPPIFLCDDIRAQSGCALQILAVVVLLLAREAGKSLGLEPALSEPGSSFGEVAWPRGGCPSLNIEKCVRLLRVFSNSLDIPKL